MNFSSFLAAIAELIGVLALVMLIGISPRINAVPPVGFKYPKREGKISLYLAVGLLVLSILLVVVWNQFGLMQSNWADYVMIGSLNLFSAVAALLVVLFLLWRRGQPAKSTGWHPKLVKIGLQFAVAIVFLIIFLQGKLFVILNGLASAQWLQLLVIALICFAEETVFRGYIQMRLSSYWNDRLGWLVTAGLFILWQIPLLLPRLTLSLEGFYLLVIHILQALLVGWMMQKSRHVLAPAVYRTFSIWLTLL